jgi:outer membrane lipoprotein-sorting protein
MRWWLTVAVAVVAAPAYAGENEAEKLFRQMEKKLQAAKTVQIRFDIKASIFGMEGTARGKAVLGEEDRVRLDAEAEFAGMNLKVTMVGDGTKLFNKDSQKAEIEIKDSPKGLGEYFRGVWPRVGIFAGLEEALENQQLPKVDDAFKVSNFKLGAKEKVGNAETRVVEYTVTLKSKDMAAAHVKVWINTQTQLPAKLELRVDAGGVAVELSETYAEFVLDGKLDAKLFEQPK